jgi:hypothetical protein
MSQSYVPFSDLVAALAQWSRERRTGVVYVATDTNHSAQINLEAGEIVFLVFRSKLGINALPLIQAIEGCRFRFAQVTLATPVRQALPPTSTILDQLARSASRRPSAAPPAAPGAQTLSSEVRTVLERALAEYIGPMVAIVCPEHFERARDLGSTIDALASEIPRADQAARFREDVTRKLGLRF